MHDKGSFVIIFLIEASLVKMTTITMYVEKFSTLFSQLSGTQAIIHRYSF